MIAIVSHCTFLSKAAMVAGGVNVYPNFCCKYHLKAESVPFSNLSCLSDSANGQ